MSASSRGWIVFALVACAAAAADLLSKQALFSWLGMPGQGRAIVLVPGYLVLETNLNEGALFGMGQGYGYLFALVSMAAITGILMMMRHAQTREDGWLVTALGLVVGGILGNLYDRLGLPGLTWHAPVERAGEPVRAVRDWIHFTLPGLLDWPVFNLADSWLVIGAVILLTLSLRPPPASGRDLPAPRAQGLHD